MYILTESNLNMANTMSERESQRIVFVDGLFVFAMILVVVGHCGMAPGFDKTYIYKWIYSFHMPIFFWLSGYLLNLQRGRGYDDYGKFLKKKSLRLLLPLFVLTTLVYYPKVLLSAFAARPAEGSLKGFVDAFLYPADNPIQPLWFLTVLFLIYAAGYWIRFFCKDSLSRLSIVLALSFAVEFVVVILGLDLNLLDLSQVFYEMPFFILGMMMSNGPWLKSRKFHSLFITAVLLAILSLSVYLKSIYAPPFGYGLCWKYFNAIVGIWFSISFILCLEDKGIRFLPQLRNYTFCIYLLQWFAMTPVRTVYNMSHGFGISATLWNVAIFAAGLFVPFFIGKFVNKHLSNKGFTRYARMAIGL